MGRRKKCNHRVKNLGLFELNFVFRLIEMSRNILLMLLLSSSNEKKHGRDSGHFFVLKTGVSDPFEEIKFGF
jgi:hypothetical protein